MNRFVIVAGASVALALAGCDSDRNQVVGEWHGTQNDQRVVVTFQADSTFTLDTGSFVGEGTYTVDEERQIVLTPTGPLAISVPAGFTGSVENRTLNLCGPGGLCTEFQRME